MFLALGDCNLLGANDFIGKTYIELLSEALNQKFINCGHTMTTTKEGHIYFNHNQNKEFDFVIIAYGLVDSWETFKYSPYVLYYPDNLLRKIGRKFVKKYKKIAKKLSLPVKYGKKNVVSSNEYRTTIEDIVQRSKKVFLVETIPHLNEIFRNKETMRYNAILKDITTKYNNATLIEIYEEFLQDKSLYFDSIHVNNRGYELIANKFFKKLNI